MTPKQTSFQVFSVAFISGLLLPRLAGKDCVECPANRPFIGGREHSRNR